MAVNVSMRDSDHRLVDELAALGIVLEAVVAGFALFTCERQLPDSILTLPMAA